MLVKPRVSLVIANHNGGSHLARCIESIRQNSEDYEIIVVDNNSTDESIDTLTDGYDLKVLRLEQNSGFARASNIGITGSSGTYVVLLNSDTTVTPSWLNRLIKTARQSPLIGLVTPKLLRAGQPTTLDSTGHVYQYQTGLCKDRGSGEFDRGQYDRSTELLSCSFACVLVKRQVFERIGLLDEKMFFYYEDVDFCLRARIAGVRVVYSPESIVYHVRGGSTQSSQSKQALDQSRRYRLRILLKNYEAGNAIRFGGKWLLLDLLRTVAGIKNRDKRYVEFYGRPIGWNLKNLPLKERVLCQLRRQLSDRQLFLGK